MKIELPEKVKFILDTLNENNYSAYIVGGCVRDSLMGKEPKDWDITTNATPDEVENIFGNSAEYQQLMKVTNANYKPPFKDVCTIATGKQYGTITVKMTDREIIGLGVPIPSFNPFEQKTDSLFEVTTFRKDGNYSDGRRPDQVEFGNSLKEDLERRDFTINAMAYSTLGGLYDPFDGSSDINKGVIKCVGKAKDRFNEDALRILRAIRFAIRFRFNFELSTYNAIIEGFENNILNNISRERIYSEFKQIMSCNEVLNDKVMNLVKELIYFMFDINGDYYFNEVVHLNFLEKLICMFKEIPVPQAEILLRTNKFSNDEVKFILMHLNLLNIKNYNKLYSPVVAKQYLRALDTGKGKESLKYNVNSFGNLLHVFTNSVISDSWKSLTDTIIENNEPYKISQLAVNGDDLMMRGIKGKDIGQTLERLLQVVIEDSSLNLKHILLNML